MKFEHPCATRLAGKLLEGVDLGARLELSRMDCPAKGVHCLNLLQTDRLTAVVYVVQHNAQADASGYLFAPHTNHYAFDAFVLGGHVEHTVFRETPDGPQSYEARTFDPETRAWQRGEGEFTRHVKVGLQARAVTWCATGSSYQVNEGTIHALRAIRGTDAVLFVLRYRATREGSTVYVADGTEVSFSGLYRRPTRDEVDFLVSRARGAIHLGGL